jgi:hydroxymethylpyrimidine/phosphomethylpyrimidine kinase
MMIRALTIAGSDSGGGAGIQADLKTFAAHGVFGTSALTALTAQNTLGVQGVYEIPPAFVASQIDSIVSDIGADATKIGMIANAAIIEAVAAKVREHGLFPLVIDPVMYAKGGASLLRDEARETLIRVLLPLATLLTPNVPEAEALAGFAIGNAEDARKAARAILRMGPKAVVVKGGHFESEDSEDLLYDGEDFVTFPARRIASKNTHGTGCTFASAIAARLALGDNLREAVAGAKDYVTRLIAASVDLGLGGGHGPLNHFALARLHASR